MPTLQGVTIWIECDGKPLEEYSLFVDNDDVATCWIPTEAGKNFQIMWDIEPDSLLGGSAHGGSIHCYMDGSKVTKCRSGDLRGRIKGVRFSPNTRRPFQFSALRVTDDEDPQSLDQLNVEKIGLISIRIFLLSDKTRTITREKGPRYGCSLPDDECVVHERCKKFGLHYVSLGESQTVKPRRPRVSETTRDYSRSTPFLTFNFRYMSEDLLRAKGVIPALINPAEQATVDTFNASGSKKRLNDGPPRTASKRVKPSRNIEVPTPIKQEQVNGEDAATLQSELDNMKGQVKSLERRLRDAKENHAIKREISPIDAWSSHGEVIDLT